jgi:hypothetical protein
MIPDCHRSLFVPRSSHTMTSFQTKAASLLAALSFSSCALESEKNKKISAPAPEVIEAPKPIEPPLPEEAPVIQPLDFADPNTTGDLITAETTKTVRGPAAKKEEAKADKVIAVPPPLPTSDLPTPPSN